MPALVAKHQEKTTVTRLKKAYSTIANAYSLAQAEHGGLDGWFTGTQHENSEILYNNLKPYLNISKDCAFNGGCFKDDTIKNINGTVSSSNYGRASSSWPTFLLQDSTAVLLQGVSSGWALVIVDVDGPVGANMGGKDIFQFRITPGKVSPYKSDGELVNLDGCSLITGSSTDCGAWVIVNENMDYLHCNDLSWGGKTKCN
jgi:hypothetical protein